MARVTPLHALSFKRPIRPSLRRIGIPDGGRDMLAVYLWWMKQRRYRAEAATEMASSVPSVFDAREEREPVSPSAQTALETGPMGCDLRGVGGQFD